MPHSIIILGQWKARINQLDGYATTLHDNIENGMYVAKELERAQELMTAINDSVSADLNASTIDGVIGEVETFLGI